MPITQSPPDMSRRPSKGDDEAQDKDTEATAGDFYGMLGYRAPRTWAITTQQWLAFRLIEL